MFKKRIIFIAVILALLALILAWVLVQFDEKDFERYRHIMSSIDSSTMNEKQRNYVVKQQREGMQKHFVYVKDGQHLNVLVDSQASNIILDHQQENTEIVENLQQSIGYIQDNLYYVQEMPMQTLRYFEADNAAYHYKSNRLVLEKVKIKNYAIPGHQVVKNLGRFTPDIVGDATTAELVLIGKDIRMKAKGLNAKFLDKDLSVYSDEGNYNGDELTLKGHVHFGLSEGHQDQYNAYADKGIYHQSSNEIVLQPNDENGECYITSSKGERIKSSEMRINTLKRSIAFITPEGNILFNSKKDKVNKMDFSSGTMTWDQEQEVVALRENVILDIDHAMRLVNDREMFIFHKTEKIQASGKTILSYNEPNGNREHVLTCHGDVVVDHLAGKANLNSPIDSEGNVIKDRQVFFQDYLGTIYADKVKLDYTTVEQQLTPKLLFMEGHVVLQNQFSQGDSPVFQYALADNVEFNPKTQNMILRSKENRRVLFFDKVNNIQVSAPMLTIKRDPNTGKDFVKGSGDVRFTFLEKELDQLRQYFNLEK